MIKHIRKLFPTKIVACVYISQPLNIKASNELMEYELKIHSLKSKSGIKTIDSKLSANNKCYAVYDGDRLVHTSWVFKNKLLATQLGFKDSFVIGDCVTIADYRGKGIFPKILQVIASESQKDLIVFVSIENAASKKSIQKAGYEKLFCFELTRFIGLKIRLHKYD